MRAQRRLPFSSCYPCRVRKVKCNKNEEATGAVCSNCKKIGASCVQYSFKPKSELKAGSCRCVSGDLMIRSLKVVSGTTDVVTVVEGEVVSEYLLWQFFATIDPQSPIPILNGSELVHRFKKDPHETPACESLMVVLEAWGSRVADWEMTEDGEEVNGGMISPLVSSLKVNRHQFADEMLKRAFKVLDCSGSLRKASYDNCVALFMMESLVAWGEPNRQSGRVLIALALEHMREMAQQIAERKGSAKPTWWDGLWWGVFTRDAISSALSSRPPGLTEMDIALFSPLTNSLREADVSALVNSSDPDVLKDLAIRALFCHLIDISRRAAFFMHGPPARKGLLDCGLVASLLAAVEESYTFAAKLEGSLTGQEIAVPVGYFRDLSSLRAQIIYTIWRNVHERLQLEQEENPAPTPEDGYSVSLRNIAEEASALFLRACRDMANLLGSYGDDVLKNGFAAEYAPVFVLHLIDTPAREEGGAILDWRLNSKINEITWLLGALKQVHLRFWPEGLECVEFVEVELERLVRFSSAQLGRYSCEVSF